MKTENKIKMEKPKTHVIEDKEEVSNLRDLDSNLIVNLLEDSIKLREMPIENKIKKKFSADKSKSLNMQQ